MIQELITAISILMCILTGGNAFTGAAEEYTSWEQLQDAINKSDNVELTLTQDIIAPGSVTDPLQVRKKNVVIDLNGYTISRNRSSALEINNTAILNNKAGTDGGALYVSSNDYAVYMNGCTLNKNTAQWGAGIYVLGGSRAIVGKTEFIDNDASKNGDVRAIFCGHDHYNSFTVEIDGVDIINTPSIKPHVLLRKINWGPRAITLHEDGTCENRVLMACELAQKEGSQLVSVGAVSKVEIFIVKIWKILVDTSLPLWSCLTGLIYGL